MGPYDVVIVGGGPAGSSCAWALRGSGLSVVVLDRARFPRDKVCGGWVTPQVVEELELDLHHYSERCTLQPLSGFRVGVMGGPAREIDYRGAVSYGIRRSEFDDYLLRRCGARVRDGYAITSILRYDGGWLINGELRARLLVGAGGHFCPVARLLGAARGGAGEPVLAQEVEFPLDPAQRSACRVDPHLPELYFCRDLKGYGWCVRKRDFLNIGLGRLDREALPQHVRDFVAFLRAAGRVGFDLPARFPGHAYLLFGYSQRKLCADAALLIGDAAGLAYPQSGEGIRTAVESGLMAAEVIRDAAGDYGEAALRQYEEMVRARYASAAGATRLARRLPLALRSAFGRWLLRSATFDREVVLNRWFLHADMPPLRAQHAPPAAARAS